MALIVFVIFAAAAGIINRINHRNDGYYIHGSNVFYHYGDDWYQADDTYGDWFYVNSFPADDYEDYYTGDDYDSDWGVEDFESSAMWEQIQEDNSYSSDDFDDWDSGGTDWDSDW